MASKDPIRSSARHEILAISEALHTLGAAPGPLPVRPLGDLLRRLALVYGRVVEADRRRR